MTVVRGLALPPPDADATRDLDVCRDALAPLLQSYVRRFPEQCYALRFGSWK